MQKRFLYTTALIAAIVILFITFGWSNPDGAQAGLCGAPDDIAGNACGNSSCHNTNPIAGDPSLKITMLDAATNQEVTTWHVVRKYIVRIELTRKSINACGFESTVETSASNKHVGSLAPRLKSKLCAFSSTYMTHINSTKTSAGYGKWEYYWTSPALATTGDIIVYAAANCANGDGHETGDSIFTVNKTFGFVPSSGIDNTVLYTSRVNVYPNPVRDAFTINYELAKPADISADLYNVNGQFVKNLHHGFSAAGVNDIKSDINSVPSGIYYVKINTGSESAVAKLIKN